MTSTMTQYVTDSIRGDKVVFTSVNNKDSVSYSGTIRGIVEYDIAQQYRDIAQYNTDAQKNNSAIPAYQTLTYFLIRLDDGTLVVFANEWIQNGSFSIIQDTTIYTIDVYDIPNNGQDSIITILSNAGYKCTVTNKSS